MIRDVLYGWCSKCRVSHFAEYKKVEGWDDNQHNYYINENHGSLTKVRLQSCIIVKSVKNSTDRKFTRRIMKITNITLTITEIMLIIRRHQCTYCGGDVESTFSTTGILAACFLFPIGNHLFVDLAAGIKNIFWATITTDGRNLIYQTLILLLRALPITYFGNFPLTQGNCFWGDPILF